MKILVIDDDLAMTDLLRLILEPASHQIITANSGPEGIRQAKLNSPDLVILDMMMPEMSGPEVCHSLRKFSNVPILILSALDSPGMVVAALEAGADEYLIKPTTSGMLLAHINKLMRRTGKPQKVKATV
ncbi:MAG: response regulator transcription factor [Anaerolineae bacterium]|nr:response regulator transcription factor [Anaerolineae bacterium]